MTRYTIAKSLKLQTEEFSSYPAFWNKNILMDNGKIDTNAIVLLVCLIRTHIENKFIGDKFQTSYKVIIEETNLTHEQAKQAVSRLVARGLIEQELDRYTYGERSEKYTTDMWLTPKPKAVRRYSSRVVSNTKPKTRRHRPKRTDWQKRVLAAKRAKTPISFIAGDKNAAIEHNMDYIQVNSFWISRSKYNELVNKYGLCALEHPLISAAILHSTVRKKFTEKPEVLIRSNSVNEDGVEKVFKILWDKYWYKQTDERFYKDQLEFSRPTLEPWVELYLSRGNSLEDLARRIIDNKREIERFWRMTGFKDNPQDAWQISKLTEKTISMWIKDLAPQIESYVKRIPGSGFWNQ